MFDSTFPPGTTQEIDMAFVIEEYNPEWPHHFQRIKSDLEGYLQNIKYISIEHIGGTAVPHLAAQPIIDVNVVTTRDHAHAVMNALLPHGELDRPGDSSRYSFKDLNQSPPRHIYVYGDADDMRAKTDLGLRNILRSDTGVRDEYARMKLEHFASGTNIDDYAEAKLVFIRNILNTFGIHTPKELVLFEKAFLQTERWDVAKTSRQVLREFSINDVVGYFELESNEENARYQDWPPRTMEQVKELVSANVEASYATPRTVWELVVEREGRMIGRVGALLTQSMVDDQAVKCFNLWFSFLPSVHGKGFATEAMQAFIDKLVERQSESSVKLEIECDPRNTGSWRLAERLGFKKHSLTMKAWESKGVWVDSLICQQMITPSQVALSPRQS
jgi:GrpB-like predicted nucleotidyltransferase (UPF0157 family)/RimJ/RimL family protein N-acetyltransferase